MQLSEAKRFWFCSIVSVFFQLRLQQPRVLWRTAFTVDLLQLSSSFTQLVAEKVSKRVAKKLSSISWCFICTLLLKGLVDTAVKTAETGYMQRRLVKVCMLGSLGLAHICRAGNFLRGSIFTDRQSLSLCRFNIRGCAQSCPLCIQFVQSCFFFHVFFFKKNKKNWTPWKFPVI